MTVPIYHTYEMREPRLPAPGDKALCGHVKHTTDPDPSGLLPWWGQVCVVCDDLDKDPAWAGEECAW